ncbi:MAG: T9SS type A sorting domain-containing protein [Sphingobacteriales bacterium]|nr:MAG: T9SS type A sorting domain-containing protein [Sphingobacteriales bacterium]
MKAKITLTALLLAGSLIPQNTEAQYASLPAPLQQTIQRTHYTAPHHPLYYTHVQQTNEGLQKTTNTQSRLLAYEYSEYNGTNFQNKDTVKYNYSGNNMGEWMGVMNYDSYVGMKYDAGGTIYDFDNQAIQTFDANGNVLDRTFNMWDAGNANWASYARDIYSYNSMNQKLTQQRQPWNSSVSNWGNDTLYEFTYDTSNHRLLFMEGKTWNDTGNYWNVSFRYGYTYDVNGDILTETLQYWSVPDVNYKNESRYKYTYNNGRMINSTFQTWNPGINNWVNNQQMNYTYNTMGERTDATVQNWLVGPGAWENHMKYNYTYDANHNVLTETSQNWTSGAFENARRTNFTYNTFDQPTAITTEGWNSGAWTNDMNSTMYTLYYEELLDVPALTQNESRIYPVPASSVINIELNWNKAETVNIAMIDAQGRVVKQWNDHVSGAYTKAVSIDDLASGSYWVKISGSAATTTKAIAIIR